MKMQPYVQESYFTLLPKRESRLPRQRFIEYYRDLHHMHERCLSAETFLLGSQYSYAELGDAVLGPLSMQGKLQDIDLLLIATWAHEFDPDYANVGAYFMNKYQLNCRVFDVADHGSLAFFTGIDLMQKYLHSSQLSTSLILLMEQTTIPCNMHDTVRLPAQDAAFALILKNSTPSSINENDYVVQSAGIFKPEENKSWHEIITEVVSPLDSVEHALKVFCKKKTKLHQKYLTESIKLSPIQVKEIPNHLGNISLVKSLNHALKNEKARWILMLDEDTETKNTGYILLRRSSNGNRAV